MHKFTRWPREISYRDVAKGGGILMTFWITDYKEPVPGDRKFYELHYGHGETSISVIVDRQTLIELKTMLEAGGF